MNDTLLEPETIADLCRVAAVLLGGVSFGMAAMLLPQVRKVWAKEELLMARTFIAVHLLVVLFVAGALAEKAGEQLSWRTPVALVAFSLKIVIFALLRERLSGRDLESDPPQRRALDRA